MLEADLELILGGETCPSVPKLKVPITRMYGCPGDNGTCGHGDGLGKSECRIHWRILETYDFVLGKLPVFLEMAVLLGESS